MSYKLLIFPLIFFISIKLTAQQKLVLSKSGQGKKVILEVGDEIIIEPINALGKTDWWGRKTGRVKAFSDSTIEIKAFLGKSRLIWLEDIGKIKKVSTLRTVYGIAVAASGAYFLATESPKLIALISLPAGLLSFIYDVAIDPMKRVDKRIWRGKNKWEMTVIDEESNHD